METRQNSRSEEKEARTAAKNDIVSDPDLAQTPSSEMLDEGELARKDNSDEKAFDALEQERKAEQRNKR